MNYDTQTNVLEGRADNDARETQGAITERAESSSGISEKEKVRFWSKVAQTKAGDCWLWDAAKSDTGYGVFKLHGSLKGAHVVAAMICMGKVPDGMKVCHTCDTPACVNPSHLFFGTQFDNMRDAKRKGRCATGKHRGEENEAARLTERDVREILLLGNTTTQAKLAAMFGVNRSTIYLLLARKTWAHIN